jgi:hypothetical protein
MPTREQLFNAVFSVQYIQVNNNESAEKVWKLFQQYNGRRSKDNYTRESFERSIKKGRMADGVLVVQYNNMDAAFFCMTNHENWLFITRHVQFGMRGLPLGSGILIPAAIKIAKAKRRHGVAFAFNEHNKVIRDIFAGKKCVEPTRFSKDRYANIRDHDVFTNAAKTMDSMISIEHPIFLNSTKQYAMYIPFTDKTPPFLDYEESQTAS